MHWAHEIVFQEPQKLFSAQRQVCSVAKELPSDFIVITRIQMNTQNMVIAANCFHEVILLQKHHIFLKRPREHKYISFLTTAKLWKKL